VKRKTSFNELPDSKISIKSEFSKLYLKNNGKFYSCLIPKFSKKFSISNKQSEPQFNKLLRPNKFIKPKRVGEKPDIVLLLQSSEMVQNKFKIPMK
jgi:hypothetical protein